MPTVYVIMERENKHTEVWRPVGVVSSETVANSFYVKDSEHRDWVSFNLDELPDNMQLAPPESQLNKTIEDTRRNVEKTTQGMQEIMQKLKQKRGL